MKSSHWIPLHWFFKNSFYLLLLSIAEKNPIKDLSNYFSRIGHSDNGSQMYCFVLASYKLLRALTSRIIIYPWIGFCVALKTRNFFSVGLDKPVMLLQGAVLFIDRDYNWISNCIELYCSLKIYSHEQKKIIVISFSHLRETLWLVVI